MNRKQMLLAMAAALLPMKLARAETPRPERPLRPKEPPLPPVSPPTIETLQAQVAELMRRVQTLEAAQAATVGFARSGDDLVLEPIKGSVLISPKSGAVRISAATDVNVRSGAGIQLLATATLDQKASVIKLN